MIVHHIPVCPFSQRLEILLALKGIREQVTFEVVDITKPRDPALLAKTRGTTALPVLEIDGGKILKESLVLLDYFEQVFPEPAVAQRDPYKRGVERMLSAMEGPFVAAGYTLVLNQDPARRADLTEKFVAQYAKLDAFLQEHNPDGTYLFDDFGWAEVVYASMFMRFWFVEYYEGFTLPASLARVARWQEACRTHPATQQVTREEIVKVYYDYAKGAGNGALLAGRTRSSFAFEPSWRDRPWPPADKFGTSATDAELGLV